MILGMVDLGAIALALPDVERGIACAGTALESRSYLTRGKAFLFVSKKDARLKLVPSSSEAKKLGFKVGANAWVTIPLDAVPTTAIAKRWVAESHSLVAGESKARAVPKKKS